MKYNINTHLDDPGTTLTHREIIKTKPFLKKLYIEWYELFISESKQVPKGKRLEIGSGGGFLDEMMPEVITSDIMLLPHCKMQFSAEEMPFAKNELSAIFMLNVFHHIPKPYLFLKEAERTLVPGGRIVMIEPANSLLGCFIYKNFHHEPFDIKGGWEIESGKPLSVSNQALPYIYFERDRKKFEEQFSNLRIRKIQYHTPFRYVLSGGVSRKPFVPEWSFTFFKNIEHLLSIFSRQIGLFETVVIEKK